MRQYSWSGKGMALTPRYRSAFFHTLGKVLIGTWSSRDILKDIDFQWFLDGCCPHDHLGMTLVAECWWLPARCRAIPRPRGCCRLRSSSSGVGGACNAMRLEREANNRPEAPSKWEESIVIMRRWWIRWKQFVFCTTVPCQQSIFIRNFHCFSFSTSWSFMGLSMQPPMRPLRIPKQDIGWRWQPDLRRPGGVRKKENETDQGYLGLLEVFFFLGAFLKVFFLFFK